MNTIYFKLEEELKKKQQLFAKMDINMFDEIILKNIPQIYNFYNICEINNVQDGGNKLIDARKENNNKLYRIFMDSIFYDNLFKKTNYYNYANDMYYNKIINKFNLSYTNSVTIFLHLLDLKKYYTNYKTDEMVHNLNLNKKYDLILLIDRTFIPYHDDKYDKFINIIKDIIDNKLNTNGTIIFEMQIFYGNDEITNELLNVIIKKFKNVNISYFYNPFVSGLSTTIICNNKQNTNNKLNNNIIEKINKKLFESIEFNYNFIVKFLQFDDIMQKSITYKLMAKF